ncbi:MAG TPA: hypothetical protein HA367_08505 [Candidatus Methanofastidiosum sp.]|nr:hypothetical protein [Methanofastidiosum sp.]
MNNIVEFAFENKQVRITDQNGENWFVLRDVLVAMDTKTTRQEAVKTVEDGLGNEVVKSIPLQTAGGIQNTLIISEPAVTYLLARSNTEEGKRLNKWIHTEVLPSIRKIGSYSVNQKQQTKTDLIDYKSEFQAAVDMAYMFGLSGNQALFHANKAVKNFHGVNCLERFELTHLISPTQQQFITPTEIGSQLSLSAKTINQKLENLGFQTQTRNHKNRLTWLVTDLGRQYAQLLDTNKKHSDGTPVMQIKWDHKVMEFIK